MEQKAQREARKTIESQRYSEFLALSTKILSFLSHHTTRIRAMLVACHKTIALLDEPKPLNLMDIMSKMLLRGTQSVLANWNNMCHNPIIKEQWRKRWSIDSACFMHRIQISGLSDSNRLLHRVTNPSDNLGIFYLPIGKPYCIIIYFRICRFFF